MFRKAKSESFVKKKKPLPPVAEPSADPTVNELDMIEEAPEETPPETQKQIKKLKRADGPRFPFLKNKTLIGVLAIAIAAVLSFVVAPLVNTASRGAVETIVVAAKDIPQGTKLEASMLKTAEIPSVVYRESMCSDIKSLVGQYTAKELLENDPLTVAKVSQQIPLPSPYLYELPVDKQAISVSVKSFSAGLSGKLLPGDVVTVYATMTGSDKENYTAIQPPELAAIEVLAVTADTGVDVDAENQETLNAENSGHTASTVTLLANFQQAAALAGLESNATIHLALTARGTSEGKGKLLEEQEAYFEDLSSKQ